MYKESGKLHKPTWRVLRILDSVAHGVQELNLSAIALELQCPKSTISPILRTLVEMHYLVLNPDTLTYSIGKSAARLGYMYLPQSSCLDLIKEQMEEMVSLGGETCHLGVLDGVNIIYMQKVTAPKPIQLISSIGKRLPAYATALGKALLFDCSKEELTALLPGTFNAFTPHTITNAVDLYEDIHRDAPSLFTYECEEITEHARCIALPLRLNGNIVAAVSISFLVFDASEEHVQKIKNILRHYSVIIEKLMKIHSFSF